MSAISREANALRRELSATARKGEGFPRAMEKVEDQLHFAKKRLGRKPSDLDINEAAILAEKVSDELEALVPAAFGASVASESRYIKGEFSEMKKLLGKMRLQLADMEKKEKKSRCKTGKIALLSFTNHARLARAKLLRLSRLQKQKDSREYKRLFSALGDAEGLSVRAEELLIKNTNARLKHKIGDTRT